MSLPRSLPIVAAAAAILAAGTIVYTVVMTPMMPSAHDRYHRNHGGAA